MSRKKTAEEHTETSPMAGGCVLVVLIGAPLAGVFAASPTAGLLTTWGVGTAALWHASRSVPTAPNPAPPPPPERGCGANPQFTVVEDRPGHCTIRWNNQTDEDC